MKKKCHTCNKTRVIMIDCECSFSYCITHRHHDCPVVRQKDLQKLRENLESGKATFAKLEKI